MNTTGRISDAVTGALPAVADAAATAIPAVAEAVAPDVPGIAKAAFGVQLASTILGAASTAEAENTRQKAISPLPDADVIRLQQASATARQATSAHALAHAEKYHPDGKPYDDEAKSQKHPALKAAQHYALLVDQAQRAGTAAIAVAAAGKSSAKVASEHKEHSTVIIH